MPSDPLCAYCRKDPAVPRWRPFCSERCKLVDLGRWLKGDYRVAGTSHEAPADASEDTEDHV
jgi:endogenous inhibitor of DNA gyrase (YacG/DUF329 family)